MLKAWQEAGQRGPRLLSVDSSGVQIGVVVIKHSGVDGCTIAPLGLMVEVSIDAIAEALHPLIRVSRSAGRKLGLVLS